MNPESAPERPIDQEPSSPNPETSRGYLRDEFKEEIVSRIKQLPEEELRNEGANFSKDSERIFNRRVKEIKGLITEEYPDALRTDLGSLAMKIAHTSPEGIRKSSFIAPRGKPKNGAGVRGRKEEMAPKEKAGVALSCYEDLAKEIFRLGKIENLKGVDLVNLKVTIDRKLEGLGFDPGELKDTYPELEDIRLAVKASVKNLEAKVAKNSDAGRDSEPKERPRANDLSRSERVEAVFKEAEKRRADKAGENGRQFLEEFPIELDSDNKPQPGIKQEQEKVDAELPQIGSREDLPNPEELIENPKTLSALNRYIKALAAFDRLTDTSEDHVRAKVEGEFAFSDMKLANEISGKLHYEDPEYIELREKTIEKIKAPGEVLLSKYRESRTGLGLVFPEDSEKLIEQFLKEKATEKPGMIDELYQQLHKVSEQEARIAEKNQEIEEARSRRYQARKEVRAIDKNISEFESQRIYPKEEAIRARVARSPKIAMAFLAGIGRGLLRGSKGVGESVKAKLQKLREQREGDGQLSPHELVVNLEKVREATKEKVRTARAEEATHRMLKTRYRHLASELIEEIAPVREAKDQLIEQARKRLQRLMDGDLESLQKASEHLQKLEDDITLDFFEREAEHRQVNTAELRKDGSLRTKDKVPRRRGEAIFKFEDIQREINMRIIGEINTSLYKAIDKLGVQNDKLNELDFIVGETLRTGIGSKGKDETKDLMARFLELEINSLKKNQKKNAHKIICVRKIQDKYKLLGK